VQVPAVANTFAGDQRRGCPKSVCLCGGVDGLARQQLLVGGDQRVRGGDAELDLGRSIFGVELADLDTILLQIVKQLRGEGVRWSSAQGP
jgi:hypothetical protein